MGAIHPSPALDHLVACTLINEHAAYARLGIISPPFRTIVGGGASLVARERTTASATARSSASDSLGACVGWRVGGGVAMSASQQAE